MRRALVVGAGLTGSTIARVLSDSGRFSVTVVDKRPHIAGNCADYVTADGLMVHRYGPDIFHTNDDRVWDFLSRFTRWWDYEHRVLADIGGILAPVPCNYTSMRLLRGREGERWISELSSRFAIDDHIPVVRLLQSTDPLLREVGEFAFETFFRGYTVKQWGTPADEVSPGVLGRVPVRMGWDDRYFTDKHQALPIGGYTGLVSSMLADPSISVDLETLGSPDMFSDFDIVVYTGAVDALCEYRFGALPYRTLRFELKVTDSPFQKVAQVNYPVSEAWTRITDYAHLQASDQGFRSTVVAREFALAHEPGRTDPYYPVASESSRQQHANYRVHVEREHPNVVLAGRLADYKYLNMDQAVARGLQVGREVLEQHV